MEIYMIGNADRKAMKMRFARIEGQLRGLQKLIDDETVECEKVAQQMSAARKALDKAAHAMLACMVKETILSTDVDAINDLENIIAKYA